MSDLIPKPDAAKPGTLKIGGLGRKAQKLQSAKEKAANARTGSKPAIAGASSQTFKAKDSFANSKKTTFQRKAV